MPGLPSAESSPKVFESIRREFGVPDGMLDISVAEIVLD